MLLLEWLTNGLNSFAIFRLVVSGLISVIAIPAIIAWVLIMLIRVVDALMQGKTPSLSQERQAALTRFWPYVGAMILQALVVLAPMLALVPGVTLAFYNQIKLSGVFLSALGLILMCVGLVVATVYIIKWGLELNFTPFTVILENLGVRQSLHSSRKLVHGRFWKTFTRVVVPQLVFGFFVIVGELLIALSGILLAVALFNLHEMIGIYGTTLLITLLGVVLRILYVPLFVIADYLVYDSLRKTR